MRAGEQELFKARAKEKGQVKVIDIITARLDADTDSFIAQLPSLQLKDVRIDPELVHRNERMLTGGFYAEIELTYDPNYRRGAFRPAIRDRDTAGRFRYPSATFCRRFIAGGSYLAWTSGRSF